MYAVLIGCGKMGGAMARSWLDQNVISRLDIIDPAPCSITDERVSHFTTLQDIDADIVILAVKPQILQDAVQNISISSDSLILSIAAGHSLSTLQPLFGASQPIVRSMPNTPAAIGKGASVSVANQHITQEHKDITERILSACGLHDWIDNEDFMDGVTALSGSGPAYVFYMIESLKKAGEDIGLSTELSLTLARQTVIGSAALAETEGDIPASTLRKNVTSPNGTTQAGLEVLMDGRFDDILRETLRAAQRRSKELNS